MESLFLFSFVFGLFLIGGVFALYIEDENGLNAGNAIRVKEVVMTPENLVPGEPAILDVFLENGGDLFVDNIRVKLGLPSVINFYRDVDKVKISRLDSGEGKKVSFSIIASPSASEGLYEGNLKIEYITHFGTSAINVGDNQEDNYTLGLIIKSEPDIFVQLENNEIYLDNKIGEIGVKFVNNGLADVKFLTVRLEDSKDYDVVDENIKYIGDLDSDDLDTANFRLNVKSGKREIALPVKISYKDSLNEDYEEEIDLVLEMRTANEIGIESNTNNYIALVVIALVVFGYWWYRRRKKRKQGYARHGQHYKPSHRRA
jgi:LPXTG-motif cell wall-anchored protein